MCCNIDKTAKMTTLTYVFSRCHTIISLLRSRSDNVINQKKFGAQTYFYYISKCNYRNNTYIFFWRYWIILLKDKTWFYVIWKLKLFSLFNRFIFSSSTSYDSYIESYKQLFISVSCTFCVPSAQSRYCDNQGAEMYIHSF